MEFIGILFSLLIAIMMTAIFAFAFKNTGPWSGFWVFFILMFFISFGAGEWAAPRGPSAWGYYWAPGLLAAVILALVLAAVTPDKASTNKHKNLADKQEVEQPEDVLAVVAVFGVFFWLLIIALIAIAIGGIVH